MPAPKKSLRCPICRKAVAKNAPDFPFCSDRCRTIDLGKWASGGYVIPADEYDPDAADLPSVLPQNKDEGDE